MKRVITILILAILPFLTCCELLNGPDELPPITMEGKNTFGCLVNGNLWLPDGSMNISKVSSYYNFFPATRFNLSFSARNVKNNSGFSFDISDPIIANQSYALNDTSKQRAFYNIGSCIYQDYHVISGVVTILKFDVQNQILSHFDCVFPIS